MLSIIINFILFASTLYIAILRVIIGAGAGQLGEDMIGIGYLKAFTNLSNIFNGICALLMLIAIIFKFKDKKPKIFNIFLKLQYVSTTAVFLTFLTVVVFLTPVQILGGNNAMFLYMYDMFHFHVFNPLLSIFLIIFVYKDLKLNLIHNFLAVVPTFAYAIVYLIMVVTGKWSDFYYFTFGGHFELIPIVLIVMLSVTFGLGLILRISNKKFFSKRAIN